MDINLEVETGALKTAVNRMQEGTEELKKSLKEMTESLDALNGTWSGSAKEAFQAEISADQELMEEVIGKVERLYACMAAACRDYARCEDAVKGMAAGISF